MRFRLIETIITEGKNIDRTWEQYKDKLSNGFCDQYDWEDSILSLDPTYVKGSDTTGDFGIWLTNMWLKGEYSYGNDGERNKITNLLKEFIKKKSNLEKKDINQYKSIEELKNVLDSTNYSDRQKDRQKRNNFKDAKLVYSDSNWEVWVPETYEASCSLGAGSGWCTADTRTRSHYDKYLKYGGKYYILISKFEPTEKYQFHWETGQFMGAGTNQGHTTNEEYSIDVENFLSKNKGVGKFFEELGYWISPKEISIKDLDIKEITLLSVEEVEQIPTKYRSFYNWWWLWSPGDGQDCVTFVRFDGSVDSYGCKVYYTLTGVRPALIISNLKSFNLPIYSKVLLDNGTVWTVISDNMLLCNDKTFGKHRFDAESNDYEKSEIKQYIHDKARELGIL